VIGEECDGPYQGDEKNRPQRGVESCRDSTFSPRSLHAEADGNRTRLGARAPTTVLKTAGPTRNPDASAAQRNCLGLRTQPSDTRWANIHRCPAWSSAR
jgi:hypothetical protein